MICLGILWPTWKKISSLQHPDMFFGMLNVHMYVFACFCNSVAVFVKWALFILYTLYRSKDWYISRAMFIKLYMSWAELKHWTTTHLMSWYFGLIHVHELADFMNLWTGRAIHAQTCHYEKWIVRSTPRTKNYEKAANNNFIIMTLLWHKVRKQILMTNRLMFILSTSNKQNKQLWNVVTTCTWGATCGG